MEKNLKKVLVLGSGALKIGQAGGRSTEPGSAPALLAELDSRLDQIGLGRIVDGVGRGVVLDRDKNYDKVKRAYDALTDGLGAWYS